MLWNPWSQDVVSPIPGILFLIRFSFHTKHIEHNYNVIWQRGISQTGIRVTHAECLMKFKSLCSWVWERVSMHVYVIIYLILLALAKKIPLLTDLSPQKEEPWKNGRCERAKPVATIWNY